MPIDVQSAVAVGAAVVGVLGWFFRLEGRVNTLSETQQIIREDLSYIRERIDKAIG